MDVAIKTFSVLPVAGLMRFLSCKLGFWVRRVRRLEWLTLFPANGRFPVIWQIRGIDSIKCGLILPCGENLVNSEGLFLFLRGNDPILARSGRLRRCVTCSLVSC